ncbi:MAG: shikimate dehydrogenase [Patescibacteria group bacterium]
MSQTFGILAYPAGHSLSPAMMNAAFQELGIEAKYEFFEIPPEGLEEFVQKVRDEKIAGLSVSIPHKEKIIPLLDEVDESVKEIGAVNTVFWQDAKLVGSNTDWLGAAEALKNKTELSGKKVVVLGGGGAARAIAYALLKEGAEISIITREAWEFEGLQKDFGEQIKKFDFIQNLDSYSPEILINATPLGMKGKFEGKSFVPAEWFNTHKPLVFDIVYNPRETQLLKDAAAAGCEKLGGLEMFVRQGAAQLEKWLPDQKVPLEVMKKALR